MKKNLVEHSLQGQKRKGKCEVKETTRAARKE